MKRNSSSFGIRRFLTGSRKHGTNSNEHLDSARKIAGTREIKSLVKKSGKLHSAYQRLFKEEARFLKSGAWYPAGWYHNEKEQVLNELADELLHLRAMSQQSIVDKVRHLSEVGLRATRAVTLTTVAAVATGVLLSILITAGITRPLNRIKEKMAEVASGAPRADLQIASPPEIASLGSSFNFMCRKLNELDSLKNDFYALMSHELQDTALLHKGEHEPPEGGRGRSGFRQTAEAHSDHGRGERTD